MIISTNCWRMVVFAGAVMAASIGAQINDDEDSESPSNLLLAGKKLSKLEIRPFGMGSFEFGQIVHGQYGKARMPVAELYRYWMQKSLLRIGLEAKQDNGLDILLAGEGILHFPYALSSDSSNNDDYSFPKFDWYIHYALAQYTLGKSETPLLSVGIGFFPFKYNPDAHNFGEYLFRTSSYPQYFPTNFDTPYQRLLGLHLSGWITKLYHHDLLVTSEVYLSPLRDYSLTYLFNVNLYDIVNVGGGIMGYRLISVDNRHTSPPEETGNLNHFTYRSIKSTVKLSISPKEFLRSDFFGEKDLRCYSEFCINGWENYPIYDSLKPGYPGYDDITKRMLLLLGFNWPTHPLVSYTFIPGALAVMYNGKVNGRVAFTEGVGLLTGVGAWLLEKFVDIKFRPDVLSIEMEWWDNNFANSYYQRYTGGNFELPEPVEYSNSGHRQTYGGPWHWSVFVQKTVLERLTFKAQVARDHTVIEPVQKMTSTGDPQEAMDGKGNWAWMFKIEFGF